MQYNWTKPLALNQKGISVVNAKGPKAEPKLPSVDQVFAASFENCRTILAILSATRKSTYTPPFIALCLSLYLSVNLLTYNKWRHFLRSLRRHPIYEKTESNVFFLM